MKNITLWQQNCQEIRARLRGNGWLIFRRLICDYRNHLGNGQRRRQQLMPYVDEHGYLFTSPALIAYAEAKAMSNLTVSRWLDRLQHEFELDGEYFILEYKAIRKDCIRLKLNPSFFVLEDQHKEGRQVKEPKKPPEGEVTDKDLSKLAKKFNRKHHIR